MSKEEEMRLKLEESSKMLDDSLRKLNETRVYGAETMEKIEQQGEQIHQMQRKVEVIEDHVNRGSRITDGMTSFWSRVKNAWFKDQSYRAEDQFSRRIVTTDSKQVVLSKIQEPKNNSISPTANFKQPQSFQEHVFERQDQQLEEMGDILKELQFMGLEMNSELSNQKMALDRLESSVVKQNERLNNTNKKIFNLL